MTIIHFLLLAGALVLALMVLYKWRMIRLVREDNERNEAMTSEEWFEYMRKRLLGEYPW